MSRKYQVSSIKYIKGKKRIFLVGTIGILLVFVFLGVKGKIEDFFFFEITKGIDLKSKSLENYYATLKPFRNWEIEELEIKARAAISVEINQNGDKKFLFKKDSKKILAIASLTKLITALISLENYDLDQKVKISQKTAVVEGNLGYYRTEESFYVKDLLYPLLMESSNEAAQALAEIVGENKFVKLMNLKAQELNLENTYFLNPTGLDPDESGISPSYSTAEDLAIFSGHLLKQPLIWEILNTEERELHTADGIFHHRIKNTNELLGENHKILGGKTGWTPMAGECLLLVLENPKNNSFLVNIILASPDRFSEMTKMIDWIYKAYKW